MADYLTEEEQIQLLKKLWKEYGVPAVIGICMAVVIVFSWRFYRQHETQKAEAASLVYAHLMIDEMNNQSDDANAQAKILYTKFNRTPYATLAALFIAKQYVMAKQYDQAQQQLQWVIAHGANDAFKQVARLRSARVSLEQTNPKAALKTLSSINNKAYKSLILETTGDAYLQMGAVNDARTAYQNALSLSPQTDATQPLLQMKLEALPPVSNGK